MTEISGRQDHWDAVYTAKAPDEVSWFQASPEPSLGLVRKHATPAASVIDVGGGASNLVDGLLLAGFRDVTVLDLSGAALAVARRRLGDSSEGVAWLVADATAWTPTRTYEVWHDRAAFHFLIEETSGKHMSNGSGARLSSADMPSSARSRLTVPKDAVAYLSRGTISCACSARLSSIVTPSVTITKRLGRQPRLSNSASSGR